MSSSSSILPDLALLDRYIFRRDDDSFPADDPTEASCTNSRGEEICICFQLHDPPRPSRLYLWWPGGTGDCDRFSVVGAHRDAVLLQMAYSIPVPNSECTYDMYDYFLYPAQDRGPGHAVLRRGAEDVAVAELQTVRTTEPELHVIFPSASASRRWVVTKPRIIFHGPDLDLENLLWLFSSDAVVPFGDYLCWVDYCKGAILLCNVFDDDPELRYLALPAKLPGIDHPGGRGFGEVNMTVGVDEERGVMKCVRVVRGDGKMFNQGCNKPPPDFVATSWTSEMTGSHELIWKKDAEVKSEDFWQLHGVELLPHTHLEFPLVSLEDTSIVYFVMRLKGASVDEVGYDYDETWLVSFDMCSKTVKASFQYIKEQGDLCCEESMFAKEKFWYFESFIPAEFPKFLKMHDTR
ncbi:hypothetical protein PR202_ga00276 [Eleusine coracana subsp. coracana]|uniref:DUF1618 domain-containing protein n=1 Tax=Eleusine coracana subsp. coracana TaxID=191504 RepID=A0AAV5BFA4_ELECO|nr:hypothetical protein PR202_ga00276 [Eleusine coracana subsp. coracana]